VLNEMTGSVAGHDGGVTRVRLSDDWSEPL
jgi:hypothetical protein